MVCPYPKFSHPHPIFLSVYDSLLINLSQLSHLILAGSLYGATSSMVTQLILPYGVYVFLFLSTSVLFYYYFDIATYLYSVY